MGRGSSEYVFFVFIHILYSSVSVVALKSLSVLLKTGISTFILLFSRFMTSILTFSEKKSDSAFLRVHGKLDIICNTLKCCFCRVVFPVCRLIHI